MSNSERPIDLLLASLLASTPDAKERAADALGEVPPEELDRVQPAVEAMSGQGEPVPAEGLGQALPDARRFLGYSAPLARFFDISEGQARTLLERIDRPEEWMDGPDVGISVMPVEAGPRAQTALASLVRLPPGVTLSEHEHVGLEQLLVLEGGFADSHGHVVWPGETLEMSLGTKHSMWGLPGPSCICGALLWMDGGDGAS